MNRSPSSMKSIVAIIALVAICPFAASEKRDLAIGDFDELNDLVENAVIQLPDTSVAEGLVLDLSISNMECTDFKVGDILLQHQRISPYQVNLQVDVIQLDMVCSLTYSYQTLLFWGDGPVDVYSYGNSAYTLTTLRSTEPYGVPVETSLESCDPDINLTDFDFKGGGIFALAPVESLLRRISQRLAERAMCNELSNAVTTKVADLLQSAKQMLAKYPEGIEINPLVYENELAPPEGMNLLNLKDKETTSGKNVQFVIKKAVELLSAEVQDPYGVKSSGMDLRINVMLRDMLLDGNRRFRLNVKDLFFATDGVLLEVHDRLTETVISLNSVDLLGLDTFTRFQPLEEIGNMTSQNELSWEYLTFQLDVTIDMKPSSLSDSVISQPTAARVVERVIIDFGFDKLDALASFLLAVNQDDFESLQLGSLLQTENLMPCLRSFIYDLEISGLSASVTNIQSPSMSGFVSPGIDRVVTNAVNGAFELYESSLLKAAPAFFELAIRDSLNKGLINSMQSNAPDAECPWLNVNQGTGTDYIDLRDLFLTPEEAREAGASGNNPYGDLSYLISELLDENFFENGDDGRPKLNSIVRSVSEAQSGTEGVLHFPENQFHLEISDLGRKTYSLLEQIEVRSFSASVAHLDSLVQPIQIGNPVDAFETANEINFATADSGPVKFSSRLLFNLRGEKSPLAMRNEFEVSLSTESMSVLADFLVTVQKKEFLEYPVRDLGNAWCWLATLPPPTTDELGVYIGNKDEGFQLRNFSAIIDELDFHISCVSCSSQGAEALPEVVEYFEHAGTTEFIESAFKDLIIELGWSYWESMRFHKLISESRILCPHSPFFDPQAKSNFLWPGIPNFSRSASETLIMLGVLALEFSIIATAKTHLLSNTEPTNPLQIEAVGDSDYGEANVSFVDFTDLSTSFGGWADDVLEEARKYLSEASREDGRSELGANIAVRELLSPNRTLDVDLQFVTFSQGGVELSARSARIFGLDSMTMADVLQSLAPQTMLNEAAFQHLRVEVTVDFTFESGESPQAESILMSFSMDKVFFRAATYAAFDLEELMTLELRSLMDTSLLLPCVISNMRAVEVPQLLVDVESIGDLETTGLLSSAKHARLQELSKNVFEASRDEIVRSLPKIFDTTIRQVINAYLSDTLKNNPRYCALNVSSGSGVIDFRDLLLTPEKARALGGSGMEPYGNSFSLLFDLIQQELQNATVLNEAFVRPWTEDHSNQSGTLVFQEAFDSTGSVKISSFEATLITTLSNARIDNIDSIGHPLSLLQPVQGNGHMLNNTLTVGVGSKPLRFAASLAMVLNDGGDLAMSNEIDVKMEVTSLTVVLSFLLNILEERFFSLPIKYLSEPSCWLSAIDVEAMGQHTNSSSLLEYDFFVEGLELNVSCVKCTSPRFDELLQLLYSPGSTEEEATKFVHQAQVLIDNVLGSDFVQNVVVQIVEDAALQCPASPEYDPDAAVGGYWSEPETYFGYKSTGRSEQMIWFNIANSIVAVCLVVIASVSWCVIRRQNRDWIRRLQDDEVALLQHQDQQELDKDEFIDNNTTSMFRSDQIPRRVRYMVPLIIVVDLGLFLMGHLALISYVNMNAEIAGEPVRIDRFLEFSFFTSALRTYNNGGNEMAILLLVFTGFWQYIKLIVSFVLWFTPPKTVSVMRRGYVFLWLDILTVLSIADVFMILVATAALLVYIGGPGEEFYNGGDLYAITVEFVPSVGLYCILIAQRLNRVSSRFFLDYHKKIINAASKDYRERGKFRLSDAEAAAFGGIEVSRSLATPSTVLDSKLTFESTNDNDPVRSDRLAQSEFLVYGKGEFEAVVEDDESLINSIPSHVIVGDSTQTKSSTWFLKTVTCGSGSSNSCCCCCRESCLEKIEKRGVLRGTVGVVFAIMAGTTILIIGSALAPSATIDMKRVLGIALDSGRSFEQAVSEFNVFRTICIVLLETRFVLDNTEDYVGLGILIFLVILTSVAFPAIQAAAKFRAWLRERGNPEIQRQKNKNSTKGSIPGFFNRLRAYRYLEIYITAFCLASWQLGAVVAYVIHLYCENMAKLFDALSYVGIVESTSAQCFEIQVTAPSTILIVAGAFFTLLFSFMWQALSQYKENKASMEELD